MAVRTTTFPYDAIDVAFGGNIVEGLLNATLQLTQDTHETVAATPSEWVALCKGMRGWQISADGGWVETNPECGIGATLSLDGGTADLKGVTDVRISIQVSMSESSSQSSSGQKEYQPTKIRTSLSIDGRYYDPLGTGSNLDDITTNVGAGTGSLSVALDFGTGSSITFTGYATSLEVNRADDEVVGITAEILATGTVTDGTAGATGLDAIMTALFARSSATVLFGSDTATETEWTGTAYVANMDITIPVAGQITWSSTWQGSGAITQQANAA